MKKLIDKYKDENIKDAYLIVLKVLYFAFQNEYILNDEIALKMQNINIKIDGNDAIYKRKNINKTIRYKNAYEMQFMNFIDKLYTNIKERILEIKERHIKKKKRIREKCIYIGNTMICYVDENLIERLKVNTAKRENDKEILRQKLKVIDAIGCYDYDKEFEKLNRLLILKSKDETAFIITEKIFKA